MNAILVTLRKELVSYCYSPVSYLVAVLFYLLHGTLLHALVVAFSLGGADADILPTQSYGLMSTFVMVVLVPALLTMRCFAEERRSGSLEMLVTAPVRDHELVLGKWGAAAAFYALLWLPTVLVLWVLTTDWFLATPLSFGPVLTAYLGMFLISAMLLAFGVFASSLTDNVLLAAILAVLCNLGLLVLPGVLHRHVAPWLDNPWVRQVYEKVWVFDHFSNWFARGLLDTSQVVFYLGGIAFFLFLTVLSLGTRRLA